MYTYTYMFEIIPRHIIWIYLESRLSHLLHVCHVVSTKQKPWIEFIIP